jgi:hypothetical protein
MNRKPTLRSSSVPIMTAPDMTPFQMRLPVLSFVAAAPGAEAAESSSQRTQRWSEWDSNPRSPS